MGSINNVGALVSLSLVFLYYTSPEGLMLALPRNLMSAHEAMRGVV